MSLEQMSMDDRLECIMLVRNCLVELGQCKGIWLYNSLSHRGLSRSGFEAILKILESENLITFDLTQFDVIHWLGEKKTVLPVPLNLKPSPKTIAAPVERCEYLQYYLSKLSAGSRPWVVERMTTSGQFMSLRDFYSKGEAVQWIDREHQKKKLGITVISFTPFILALMLGGMS